jgi:hypothetical protein
MRGEFTSVVYPASYSSTATHEIALMHMSASTMLAREITFMLGWKI